MKNIQQKVEEILATEPFVRMRDIEITAIVTGRASEYFGETTVEVLTKALQDQRAEVLKELEKEVLKLLLLSYVEGIRDGRDRGSTGWNLKNIQQGTERTCTFEQTIKKPFLTLLSTPNQEL